MSNIAKNLQRITDKITEGNSICFALVIGNRTHYLDLLVCRLKDGEMSGPSHRLCCNVADQHYDTSDCIELFSGRSTLGDTLSLLCSMLVSSGIEVHFCAEIKNGKPSILKLADCVDARIGVISPHMLMDVLLGHQSPEEETDD
jgi:hypothetical protein